MASLGPWLSAFSGITGLVLAYAASLTVRDDGSRLYTRETLGLCAVAMITLAVVLLRETDGGQLIRLSLIGLILMAVGGRLFFYQRRRTDRALD